jgi:hypothetical protein
MATSTIQTNANNDLYLPDGQNLLVISGIAACTQNIQDAALMRTGEDLYDVTSGVDYFGTIFTPQPDPDAAIESLSEAILSCPDTVSLAQLTVSISSNSFNYTAIVNTIYGQIPVSNP